MTAYGQRLRRLAASVSIAKSVPKSGLRVVWVEEPVSLSG